VVFEVALVVYFLKYYASCVVRALSEVRSAHHHHHHHHHHHLVFSSSLEKRMSWPKGGKKEGRHQS
jgi:hypothetical protein